MKEYDGELAICDISEFECTQVGDKWHLSFKKRYPTTHIPLRIIVNGKHSDVEFFNTSHDYDQQHTIFKDSKKEMILFYHWDYDCKWSDEGFFINESWL